MTPVATPSSPWIPEDDLLLKNSIETGASLEALAKGAVNFSRRYTLREIRDRWYSLLYDPDVSTQASARMAELELSGSNPSTKSRLDSLKGAERGPGKRKFGSIRKHYYAMRKRIKNEFFSSQNLGFFEERNLHNYNHQQHKFQDTTHGGDAMLDDCLANNLGLEEKDFEILRQAFPESLPSISTTATTTTTTAIVDKPANVFHSERCQKSDFINDAINASASQNELIVKNATCIDDSGPSETPPNEKLTKSDKSVFGGKHHFNSPVSDGSASFHTMGGFSSPSTRQPLWKTMEDVSAPDMPVDDNNAESHQVTKETLPLPVPVEESLPGCDGSHQVPLLGDNDLINSIGVQEGEYTDLPESLLNFSNEDDIIFMDVDAKDTVGENAQEVDNDIRDAATSSVASPNLGIPSNQCQEELKDSSFHSDQHDACNQELTEGKIICTLNREDPDIPCNDDIFLLIHPSTQFAPSAVDSIGPLSSSSHEKECEQGLITVRKGKDPAPSFPRSLAGGPTALPAFKREPPDGEYVGPLPGKPNNLRIPSQTRSMNTPLVISGNGIPEENVSKVEPQVIGSPTMYSEMPLPLEAGTVKVIDPESMGDSYISDDNSDSDGDIPYFSEVEAMIHEMDLDQGQESSFTSEVAKYQFEDAKKMIMRLEQAARSSFQRALTAQGALAVFYGRCLKQYIKKPEVIIGRSTDDTEVDIDLRKEGHANKISRRQAIIKMGADGSFSLKNLGASSISINGKTVAHGQVVALASSCLIEIRGMSFVFEINDKYVRRFLENQRAKE